MKLLKKSAQPLKKSKQVKQRLISDANNEKKTRQGKAVNASEKPSDKSHEQNA